MCYAFCQGFNNNDINVSSAYGLGTPEALYDGFRESVSESWDFSTLYPNIDVGAVFDSWVQNPGAPVLNVNVNMNTGVIAITQVK